MSNTQQLDILYKLKKEVAKSKNERLTHIINQVIKKVYLNQFTTTFVGHFSAGKSTLINLLLEQQILPSSPVPTTSNTAIVSVDEREGIIANLSNQQYTELTTYDEVKAMNKANIDVESVEIKFPSTKFNKGFTLQDTPGVDSNVSTHQTSTEQFMYTSNIIFYTVDYNHVQSALNFQFMKQLNQAGIPVVFVINQVDKHNDEELAFETFQDRINKSLADWQLDIEKIFYVSKFDNPHNEISQLSDFLVEQDNNREALDTYVDRIVKFITDEQLSYIQHEIHDILEQLAIDEEDFDQAYLNFQQHQQVSEEAQLLNNPEKLYDFLAHKRKDILDNAYIMTHDMRELIRNYLESRTKNFKVGGLFNKRKKTEEEQDKRLSVVISNLQDKVNQQIRQPLREDMSFLTRFINSTSVNEAILNQHYDITASMISDLYKPQINISNQYVLTFCDEIIQTIQQHIKKETEPLFDKAIKLSKAQDIGSDEVDDYNDYEKFMELRNLRESLETKNYRHYYIHIDDSLDKLIDRTKITFTPQQEQNLSNNAQHDASMSQVETDDQSDKILEGLKLISDVPMFDQTKQDIQSTVERMEQKIVKIGVFGTFSAGKSSLINALLGKQYLISSPNPTTAAMTEISYGHDSAITLKSEEQLLEELNNMFEINATSFQSFSEFFNTDIEKLKHQLEKNQLAFVHALENHYDAYKAKTASGLVHQIESDEIRKWSAVDEYAAFVNTVHLKLPLEWLKNKIIVDSLGLHSNNQRHTNETEKVLTSSDLILYVSYFNHAFTDNDKKFIEHMKEMNQLNSNQAFKMIINATDLAESDEDLSAVFEYVDHALAQVNLASKIYPVSSRQALQDDDTSMQKLRDDISHFALVESKHILQQQMLQRLTHVSQAYTELIEEFKNNKAQIEQRTQKLTQLKDTAVLPHNIIQNTEQRTDNEVEDQIYHLNERLKLQLKDEVKSVYNSQMTKNKNFNEAKTHATKIYLNQIHQRFYLEQTLLFERIKKHFIEQFNQEVAPIQQSLEQLHVFISPEIDLTHIKTDHPYLRIELQDMLAALPKSLTKRKLLEANTQQTLQEDITVATINLLTSDIADFREALNDSVTTMAEIAETNLKQLELEIQAQINELLSFDIDDSLIKQLEFTNKKLQTLLAQ